MSAKRKKTRTLKNKINKSNKKNQTHRLDLHVGLVGLDNDNGLALRDLVSGLLEPRDDLFFFQVLKERKRSEKSRREK